MDLDFTIYLVAGLLSNCCKFTPTGGRVDVGLASTPDYAQIRVSDTGQGISAKLLPHIFDRFRQGDASSTKTNRGLGLGLAIVWHIVELHCGSVWAESAGEGQGTTFVIQFPLEVTPGDLAPVATERRVNGLQPVVSHLLAAGTDAAPAAPTAIGNPEVFALDGLRILVVDDEVDILDLIKYILEKVGAAVTIVSSAQDAMAALAASGGKYDALLADIGMPGEDGFALIRQVRALDVAAGGQIPAAAITAYVSDGQRQLAISAGFQVHVSKPVVPAHLIQMVANLTGRASQHH